MPTALILGVSSQDGSYLAELLVAKNYRVIGTIRPGSCEEKSLLPKIPQNFTVESADLLSFESIANLVKKYQPDEFYNLAALTSPASSWDEAYLVGQVTGLGPVNCLEAIRLYSPQTRFFQASSREIFEPVNPYGAAKAYAHFMTHCYRQSFAIFASTGILFNHESPRRSPDFVTRKVSLAVAALKLGLKGNRIPLGQGGKPVLQEGKLELGNLDAQRDWGFAGDYVEAIWQILQYDQPDDWVVATGVVHTVQELCETAFSLAGLNWQDYVVVNPEWVRPIETGPLVGDYSKIKKALGWQPKVQFKELIEMMLQADLARLS